MKSEGRKLTDHIVNEGSVNAELSIEVLDAPGQGGAHHEYGITFGGGAGEILGPGETPSGYRTTHLIRFQNGPIKEFGVNGITGEALIAIQIDRLRSFQKGPFSCRENAIALTHLEEALMWLQKRTRERLTRGVEGTNQK